MLRIFRNPPGFNDGYPKNLMNGLSADEELGRSEQPLIISTTIKNFCDKIILLKIFYWIFLEDILKICIKFHTSFLLKIIYYFLNKENIFLCSRHFANISENYILYIKRAFCEDSQMICKMVEAAKFQVNWIMPVSVDLHANAALAIGNGS